mmetsp:Transcript_11512/g.20372  ORF Transcript_11512/g.20372 Transcript_11512/m.20372 type:complete len:246 (+) Transcript_11512:59-796(+)
MAEAAFALQVASPTQGNPVKSATAKSSRHSCGSQCSHASATHSSWTSFAVLFLAGAIVPRRSTRRGRRRCHPTRLAAEGNDDTAADMERWLKEDDFDMPSTIPKAVPKEFQQQFSDQDKRYAMVSSDLEKILQDVSQVSADKFVKRSGLKPLGDTESAAEMWKSESRARGEAVEGLMSFLWARGCTDHFQAANAWCIEMGADSWIEVAENADDLTDYLIKNSISEVTDVQQESLRRNEKELKTGL